MRHTPRTEIVGTEEGYWLAVCYECGWHGDTCRMYAAAAVDLSAHEREAKR